jgi:hypothetical protein
MSDELLYGGENLIRKYLYIYGGFSYLCETACADIWRYEIPYFPISMAPVGKVINAGNHWTSMQEDLTYGPGKRYKVTMISYQRPKDEFND